MVLGLTATPIAMKHYGFDLSQIAVLIQLHILGRFVPVVFYSIGPQTPYISH